MPMVIVEVLVRLVLRAHAPREPCTVRLPSTFRIFRPNARPACKCMCALFLTRSHRMPKFQSLRCCGLRPIVECKALCRRESVRACIHSRNLYSAHTTIVRTNSLTLLSHKYVVCETSTRTRTQTECAHTVLLTPAPSGRNSHDSVDKSDDVCKKKYEFISFFEIYRCDDRVFTMHARNTTHSMWMKIRFSFFSTNTHGIHSAKIQRSTREH